MSKQPSNKPNNSLMAPLAVGFFIGVITVGTVVLVWNHDREPPRYSAPPASETSATPLAPPALAPPAFSQGNL